VIGHSVEDHIHLEGTGLIRPGGIFYTAAALVNYKNTGDEIFLCTDISKNKSSLFSSVYDQLDKSFIRYSDRIASVHLIVKDKSEREEYYENIGVSLQLPPVNFNIFDGILLNMISGYDILPDQLENLRKVFHGLIYMDVHTLSRGTEYIKENRIRRDFRIIPDFRRWAVNTDIIQVNKQELRTLFAKKTEQEIVAEVMNCGIKHLIVTMDEEGAVLFSQCEENKRNTAVNSNFYILHEKAIKIRNENKIGCGDVFGAVFFYNYIKHKKAEVALKAANCAAGAAAGFRELADFKKLRDELFE
jgi:sugar/nucleoside kinase (ribokinase family)